MLVLTARGGEYVMIVGEVCTALQVLQLEGRVGVSPLIAVAEGCRMLTKMLVNDVLMLEDDARPCDKVEKLFSVVGDRLGVLAFDNFCLEQKHVISIGKYCTGLRELSIV